MPVSARSLARPHKGRVVMKHDNVEALNRLLDDLAHGVIAIDGDLDPDLVATVRWFRDLGTDPTPDPALRVRMEHHIMSQLVFAPSAGRPAITTRSPGLDRSRILPPASPPRRLPRLQFRSARIAAALLLATISLVYLALGPLR